MVVKVRNRAFRGAVYLAQLEVKRLTSAGVHDARMLAIGKTPVGSLVGRHAPRNIESTSVYFAALRDEISRLMGLRRVR
jgi:hypothetical protein